MKALRSSDLPFKKLAWLPEWAWDEYGKRTSKEGKGGEGVGTLQAQSPLLAPRPQPNAVPETGLHGTLQGLLPCPTNSRARHDPLGSPPACRQGPGGQVLLFARLGLSTVLRVTRASLLTVLPTQPSAFSPHILP